MNINIKDLAKELGLTRQVLNFHILKGRAGTINKNGSTHTSEWNIEVSNILVLIRWLKDFGRGSKIKLLEAEEKYEQLNTQE